jgi:hypothetical protein
MLAEYNSKNIREYQAPEWLNEDVLQCIDHDSVLYIEDGGRIILQGRNITHDIISLEGLIYEERGRYHCWLDIDEYDSSERVNAENRIRCIQQFIRLLEQCIKIFKSRDYLDEIHIKINDGYFIHSL